MGHVKSVAVDTIEEINSKVNGDDASVSTLPAGAKLDYREDVDRERDILKIKLDESAKRSQAASAELNGLIRTMKQTIAQQNTIFSQVGIRLGSTKNPIVEGLRGRFDGLDDFDQLSRQQEMRFVDAMGLTPKEGWAVALSKMDRNSIKTNTISEISSILSEDKESVSTGSTESSQLALDKEADNKSKNKEKRSSDSDEKPSQRSNTKLRVTKRKFKI